MSGDIRIKEERVSAREYIEFLKRTDLGAQYPKERFEQRIARLVDHVSISLTARNRENQIVGVLFGLTDYACPCAYSLMPSSTNSCSRSTALFRIRWRSATMRGATSHVLITPSCRFPSDWQLRRSILRLSGSRLKQPGLKPGNPSRRKPS